MGVRRLSEKQSYNVRYKFCRNREYKTAFGMCSLSYSNRTSTGQSTSGGFLKNREDYSPNPGCGLVIGYGVKPGLKQKREASRPP